MKTTHPFARLIVLFILLLAGGRAGVLHAQQPVVNAILFYSPTCGHCHYVISEVLPPLFEQHGEQLQMIGIDISEPDGQVLYQNAIDELNISEQRRGVPTLLVANRVLVGSGEIPDEFPGLITDLLASGGAPWPQFTGLDEVLAANGLIADEAAAPAPTSAAAGASAAAEAEPAALPVAPAVPLDTDALAAATTMTAAERFMLDPVANTLAVAVLAGLMAALVFAAARLWQTWQMTGAFPLPGLEGWQSWAVALLALLGGGVAAYLAFVETTGTLAVCGPVGDCNTVQQSAYARLFGVLPVGVAGLFGYAAILLAWAGLQWGQGSLQRFSGIALVLMAFGGTLFSIYLTFLEPFVIGASCVWCLTSAVAMGLILFFVAQSLTVPQPKKRMRAVRA